MVRLLGLTLGRLSPVPRKPYALTQPGRFDGAAIGQGWQLTLRLAPPQGRSASPLPPALHEVEGWLGGGFDELSIFEPIPQYC